MSLLSALWVNECRGEVGRGLKICRTFSAYLKMKISGFCLFNLIKTPSFILLLLLTVPGSKLIF